MKCLSCANALEDQRNKNEEAAKASLTQKRFHEAHVAKLDAQLSTATARNKTLEDEVETLERKGLELTKQLDEVTARVERDAEKDPRRGHATERCGRGDERPHPGGNVAR